MFNFGGVQRFILPNGGFLAGFLNHQQYVWKWWFSFSPIGGIYDCSLKGTLAKLGLLMQFCFIPTKSASSMLVFFVSERFCSAHCKCGSSVRYMPVNAKKTNRTCEFLDITWFFDLQPSTQKNTHTQVNLAQPTSSCNPGCWWIPTVTSASSSTESLGAAGLASVDGNPRHLFLQQ